MLPQPMHLDLRHFTLALLSAPHDQVVLHVARNHPGKVKVLRVSSHVPRLHVDIQVGRLAGLRT
jgi:hypothetical protein